MKVFCNHFFELQHSLLERRQMLLQFTRLRKLVQVTGLKKSESYSDKVTQAVTIDGWKKL